jgi:transposase
MVAVLEVSELLGPSLTEEEARAIYAQGEEAVVFALLDLARRLAQAAAAEGAVSHQTPATPSGMKPPHAKPPVRRRGKRPGRKAGHPGSRRGSPLVIHHRRSHRAEVCPHCGGPLCRCHETRVRVVEDIPATQPEVTEHTIHRDWCAACQKKVEPRLVEALPGASLGNRVLVLSAWLHYCLGNTCQQIVDVFGFHFQMRITAGGLVQMWHRLARILYPWYEQIQQQALHSAVLHGDESGWRVNGKTHWLWCFANRLLTFFMIDRSRGSPALRKFFVEAFEGVLVSDFWAAYNAVVCALRQTCLVHLLRELEHTEKYKSPARDWPEFARKLRRLLRDAIRLWRRKAECPQEEFNSRRERLTLRLAALIEMPWRDSHARRLMKRLRRHQNDLFTFLDQPDVPFENNEAERAIRPAVIIRKNSYGNRSDRGADTQAILMSIMFTLKKRGHNPVDTILTALAIYLETKQLPPLPGSATADG